MNMISLLFAFSCVFIDEWTEAECHTLLQNILTATCGIDDKPYKLVEQTLDWEAVRLEDRTVKECQIVYHLLTKKVRKYRTSGEVTTEALEALNEKEVNKDSEQKEKGRNRYESMASQTETVPEKTE